MHPAKPFHGFLLFSLFLLVSTISNSASSATLESLGSGSSLSVEKPNDVLVSPDGGFSAGFYNVGDNAYCFAIWFTKALNKTVVWMANRDQPVNGRRSKLSIERDGNLILSDAGQSNIWTTNTTSTSSVRLLLLNTGNLVLQSSVVDDLLWQSFDFPTDTLLPQQPLTRNTKLISHRSISNYSSGFYSLFFDGDNTLRLLFSGPEFSSIYWYDPWLVSWEAGRTSYNNSRIAMFNSSGYFESTDDLRFFASDFGSGPMRRLTMEIDGNLRLYSLDENKGTWAVSWQGIAESCRIHGVCGPNGLCEDGTAIGRRCSCPPGFKVRDSTDWSKGCEPSFNFSCDPRDSTFLRLPLVDFYGYDLNFTEKITLEACQNICLNSCSCKAFMYLLDGSGRCYPKTLLLNGRRSLSFIGFMHFRVPKNGPHYNADHIQRMELSCSTVDETRVELVRRYETKQENNSLKYLLWFVSAMGGAELICILTGWWYLNKHGNTQAIDQGYIFAAIGFRKFTYQELKKATRNFSQEIGRGGGGVVYKGVLSDQRVAAIKRLERVNQGEAEFLAEVNIIGRINHMNLIQMWGFCAQGNHWFLVFEYMDHGSLAENLSSNSLDWGKRFEIAVGTARGLAYLHEECLEWVLHLDVKPQNILLDANYKPKVADFGMSKLLDRDGLHNSSFSTIRGTRGYMAPEWILNLPITSKVDVYSYGIVVLEMVTGKGSVGFNVIGEEGEQENGRLVKWVREKMGNASTITPGRIGEVIDQKLDCEYDAVKMEMLVRVAMQCVEEEKDARPTMSQVVEMLLCHEYDI